MKIIFLDIDGVLATQRTRYNTFDRRCVHLLNRILRETDAKICVSSTWRIGETLESMRETLRQGFSRVDKYEPQGNDLLADAFIGMTPRINEDLCRGREIDQWINNRDFEVEAFVILDDDSDMEPHMKNLVKTDPYLGLNYMDMLDAIKILGKNEDRA